jgi:hypothetical protein
MYGALTRRFMILIGAAICHVGVQPFSLCSLVSFMCIIVLIVSRTRSRGQGTMAL